MSTDTQEVVRLYELLPERERAEVADFARFLLQRAEDATTPEAERWLASAVGGATAAVTTDAVLLQSRGEA